MDVIQLKGTRVIAVALAALGGLAACAIPLRGRQDTETQSDVTPESDALDRGLMRCRNVSPAQADALEQCRQVWAENRRRFLEQDRSGTKAAGASGRDGSSIVRPASPR